MKRILASLLALLLIPCIAFAMGSLLTEEEYAIYYEVSEYLCSDWEMSSMEILDIIADDYYTTAEELYYFMVYAAEMDDDHVWIPIHGGKKYHGDPLCSNMKDPRPTTKEIAKEFLFDPCKRCKPGL